MSTTHLYTTDKLEPCPSCKSKFLLIDSKRPPVDGFFYNFDKVACPKCSKKGEIDVDGDIAFVSWDEVDEEVLDKKETTVIKTKNMLETMVGGSHYKGSSIQPIQFYHANPQLSFQETNIIKYAYRHRNKNGLQDLKKVIHYTLVEAEFSYPKEDVDKFKEDILELLLSDEQLDKIK